MSDSPLLHFTEAEPLESILRAGELRPGAQELGVFPIPSALKERHRSVCFTEVSVQKAARHAAAHGRWGIALNRSWIEDQGARPVRYLSAEETAEQRYKQDEHSGVPSHPFWNDTPYLSPTLPTYEFRWEREWRHVGVLEFPWDAVEFLISPEGRKSRVVPEGNLGHVSRVTDQRSRFTSLEWEDGDSEPFNRVMRGVVRDFAKGYLTPEDAGFITDKDDDTGYWWPVRKYSEWEILEDLVPPMPDHVIADLACDLQSHALAWASVAELDELQRDAEAEFRRG